MFSRLKALLPKTRADRISFASLLVTLAALANDIFNNVTSDDVTVSQLERALREVRSERLNRRANRAGGGGNLRHR